MGPLSGVISCNPILSKRLLATAASPLFKSVPLWRASDIFFPPRRGAFFPAFAFGSSAAKAPSGKLVPVATMVHAVAALEKNAFLENTVWRASDCWVAIAAARKAYFGDFILGDGVEWGKMIRNDGIG